MQNVKYYTAPEIAVYEIGQTDIMTGSLTLKTESLGDKLSWVELESL